MRRWVLKDSAAALLVEYPFLAGEVGWDGFVREYDDPPCIKKRADALKAFRPQMGQAVSEMDEFCQVILNKKGLARRGRPNSILYTSLDEVRERITAAVALAEKVELLFSPCREGAKIRHALKAEAKRRAMPPLKYDKATPATVVCYSFLRFVHREECLPTKKQLNVEANRLTYSEGGPLAEMRFGEVFHRGGMEYRIYDCVRNSGTWEDDTGKTWFECRIVPSFQWDQPRWPTVSGMTEFTTPLGLKGLPEAHNDKGKLRS